MQVILQLRSTPRVRAAAFDATASVSFTSSVSSSLLGLAVDPSYMPVAVPGVRVPGAPGARFSLTDEADFDASPEESTYIVRGTLPDTAAEQDLYALIQAHPEVVGVYADARIEPVLICPGAPPLGTAATVKSRLGTSALAARGLKGKGVYVAIVDTGINRAHLLARGMTAPLDVARSWTPVGVSTTPGNHPVGHGTMCAYDALLAAPQATLLDHAVLRSTATGPTVMSGLLSDAIKSYAKLYAVLTAMPTSKRAMVVNNSWGMFNPSWDFPVGHPGNYSDNPLHPFNIMVASLTKAGADVLFAAGNCGRNCPDGRCAFGATRPICGANSHPAVISVGGVDVKKNRVGYSSQGPGRLEKRKPDICAYTHFAGSGVYAADGGTSAACPVAAGVVAAMRTKYRVLRVSSAQMLSLVERTAEDRGPVGFDYDYGWGIIDPARLLTALGSSVSPLSDGVLEPVASPRRGRRGAKREVAPRKPRRRVASKA